MNYDVLTIIAIVVFTVLSLLSFVAWFNQVVEGQQPVVTFRSMVFVSTAAVLISVLLIQGGLMKLPRSPDPGEHLVVYEAQGTTLDKIIVRMEMSIWIKVDPSMNPQTWQQHEAAIKQALSNAVNRIIGDHTYAYFQRFATDDKWVDLMLLISVEANDIVADELGRGNPGTVNLSYQEAGEKFRANQTSFMPPELRQALANANAEWDGKIFVRKKLIK